MKKYNSIVSITLGLIALFISACNAQKSIEPTVTFLPSITNTSTSLPTVILTATETLTPTEIITPKPGTLVFSSCNNSICAIYSINNDGSDLKKLTGDMVDIFNPQWSPDGTRIIFEGYPNIYLMNADGSDLTNLTKKSEGRHPDWAPDGKQIVFDSLRSGNDQIYTINIDGTGLKRLTNNSQEDTLPQWSPNGRWITYMSTNNLSTGGWDYVICVINSIGSGITELTLGVSPYWSPDSKNIAYSGVERGISDIFMIKPDGTGIKDLSNSPADEFGFTWSPDNKFIAYVTNINFNADIYKVCVDCESNKPINLTTSDANDQNPSWSPDGTQIAYISNDVLCIMNADGSNRKCFGISAIGTIDWKPQP